MRDLSENPTKQCYSSEKTWQTFVKQKNCRNFCQAFLLDMTNASTTPYSPLPFTHKKNQSTFPKSTLKSSHSFTSQNISQISQKICRSSPWRTMPCPQSGSTKSTQHRELCYESLYKRINLYLLEFLWGFSFRFVGHRVLRSRCLLIGFFFFPRFGNKLMCLLLLL
jgi:hypothetical protein